MGYYIQLNGEAMAVDGTSCSAPVFSGVLGLLAAKKGGKLGHVAPLLYKIYEADNSAFNDVPRVTTSAPSPAATAPPASRPPRAGTPPPASAPPTSPSLPPAWLRCSTSEYEEQLLPHSSDEQRALVALKAKHFAPSPPWRARRAPFDATAGLAPDARLRRLRAGGCAASRDPFSFPKRSLRGAPPSARTTGRNWRAQSAPSFVFIR